MAKSTVAWILLVAAVFGGASLGYPWTDWDTASATYIASTMLEGGAPYRDAWNIKFPGVNFAYALSILLFGKSAFGLRLFDLLWQSATALVLGLIAARVYKHRTAAMLAGAGYLILYYTQGYWTWVEPDGFSNLPMALGFLALLHALEKDHWVAWGLAAACVGVSVLFKAPLGLFGVAMMAAAVAQKPRGLSRVTMRLASLAAGVILPWVACAAYLAAKGALDDFLLAAMVVAPQYVARIRATVTLGCLWDNLRQLTLFPLYVCGVVGILFVARSLRRGPAMGAPVWLLLGWIAVGVISFALHGVFFSYHLLPVFAPTALLAAGAGLALFSAPNGGQIVRIALRVGVAVLFLAYPVYRYPRTAFETWQTFAGHPPTEIWWEVGQQIRQQTAVTDRIFVWGNKPVVYLYAERKSASRFIISYFLSIPWRGADYQQVFLEEFRAQKPRYFVLVKEEHPGPCTGREIGALEAFERFVALKEIIAAEYRVESETPSYILYVRPKANAGYPDAP